MSEHNHIDSFIPDIVLFNKDKYFSHINEFSASQDYPECSDFLRNQAQECIEDRNGVTYLVFDKSEAKNPVLAAFFTIISSAIPCNSRMKLEPEEAKKLGKEYIV